MRTIIIVTASVLATAAACYFLMPSVASLSHATSPPSVAARAAAEPLGSTQGGSAVANDAADARTSERLAAIEAQIQAIATPKPAREEPAANPDPPAPPRKKFTESDFGHWMDDALDGRDWDRETTALATQQAEQNLAQLPDLELDGLDCSSRFCKATVLSDGAELPLADLFGSPPFIGEGFTLKQPDGSTALYFTRPGESLAQLRTEAKQSLPN